MRELFFVLGGWSEAAAAAIICLRMGSGALTENC